MLYWQALMLNKPLIGLNQLSVQLMYRPVIQAELTWIVQVSPGLHHRSAMSCKSSVGWIC